MEITADNSKEYANNVMDAQQVRDYNNWAGTSYKSKDELLENETDEKIAEFYAE